MFQTTQTNQIQQCSARPQHRISHENSDHRRRCQDGPRDSRRAEFDLLAYLMRFSGQIVTRPMLALEVWREPNRSTPLDNVIDVHLARLRKKVDDDRPVPLIRTVRGVGFILETGERKIHVR